MQNRFNSNIVIYGNVLVKQQQLYLCQQNLVVQKIFYATFSYFFLTLGNIYGCQNFPQIEN